MTKFKSWVKRASGSVETAIRVVIAVVLGALILLGLYAVVNGLVVPTTQAKVESLYDTPFATAELAGVGGTSTPVSTFTFTIFGTEYTYEEGMTWAEWCDSEYNTAGWYVAGNYVYMSANNLVTKPDNGQPVRPVDTVGDYDEYYRLLIG